LCRQEGVDHGVGDEATVLGERHAAAKYEEFVQLGRAVGPENVGCLRDGDAGAKVARVVESAGVFGHATVPVGVDLGEQGLYLGVGTSGGAEEQHDGDGPGGELGGERPPGSDDLASVPLSGLELVGSLLGRNGTLSFQRPPEDGADETGFAAE